MASRAHVINDYSFRDSPTHRRPLRFQTNDPVVLPRSRSWDINGALIGAALAATTLVAGATYAVFYTEPTRLAATPAVSIERDYQPNSDWARVNVMKALSGPVVVTPSVVQPLMSTTPVAEMSSAPTADTVPNPSEVVIDDSAPGAQDTFPQPAESQPSAAPYPNPTTTPPDLTAPDASTLDRDNPYQ